MEATSKQKDSDNEEIFANEHATQKETKLERKKLAKKYSRIAKRHRIRGNYDKALGSMQKFRTANDMLDKRFSFKRDEYGNITRYNFI